MAKRDTIASILIKKYKESRPSCGYVQILSFAGETTQWTDEFLHDMKDAEKRKKFFIQDIEPLECKELPQYANSLKFRDRTKKSVPIFGEKTGLFKITFNDGNIMVFGKWFSGGGKSTVIESMFATENNIWSAWLKLFQEEKKRKQKPKPGTYRLIKTDYDIVYEPIKKMPTNDVVHEEVETVFNSVNYFFENVQSFMKYNQPGRRSILLYGEQGTGKTSILYKLAQKYEKDTCVVFATDISSLAIHIQRCEKHNMRTLGFFEDAEAAFSQNHSGIKNFLSGIDAKQNKGGTCIVYTTNYPERIEDTIIERPERIDELIKIGHLLGVMLVNCAKFYFGELLPADIRLERILTKPMTGAEVKLMVENTLRYCASKQIDISEDAIEQVLYKYRDDIKKLHDFSAKAKTTYAKDATKKGDVGFVRQESPVEFDISQNNGHK